MRAVALALACLLFAAGADPEYVAAVNEAAANEKTPEGKNYDLAFGRSFAEKHQRTMVTCTESQSGPDLAPFDVLVRVGPNGKIDRLLIAPRTKVARCLERRMADDIYPPPPSPGWWVRVRMSIRE